MIHSIARPSLPQFLRRARRQHMVVVPRVHWFLWLTPLRLLFGAAALLGAFYLGDLLARRELTVANDVLERAAEERASELAGALAALEVERDLATSGAEVLRSEISGLNSDNWALLRENLMLRAVVAGTPRDDALRIAHFEIRQPVSSSSLRYRLLLTRDSDDAAVGGSVTIDLVGTRDGEPLELPLSSVAALTIYPLPVNIRTYQGLTGEFVVPEGFEPREVRVRAELDEGGQRAEEAFPWQVGLL